MGMLGGGRGEGDGGDEQPGHHDAKQQAEGRGRHAQQQFFQDELGGRAARGDTERGHQRVLRAALAYVRRDGHAERRHREQRRGGGER